MYNFTYTFTARDNLGLEDPPTVMFLGGERKSNRNLHKHRENM